VVVLKDQNPSDKEKDPGSEFYPQPELHKNGSEKELICHGEITSTFFICVLVEVSYLKTRVFHMINLKSH
jgi:hypothetical protein